MPNSRSKALWVVIHCAKDDSHVLVQDNDVIYEDGLEVGVKVNFYYPGEKEILQGVVQGTSGKL